MARTKRSQHKIESDRAEISRLTLRGLTQMEIAAKLGMTQPMVSYDLAAIRKSWRTQTAFDLDAAKAEELAKINHLEFTIWQELETSERPHVRTVKDYAGKKIRRKTVTTTKGGSGNSHLLSGILRCIDQRCKILGLYAPAKVENTGTDGGPIRHDFTSTAEAMLDKFYGNENVNR
jgi:predicted transcriptional regulator